ncbi:DUF937 domain-containing protein [Salinimicrobium sediminilitoris]|uniref:DUF937 domain-containing protein n=1 Tax=Salinimicrobium sediminilitoris TaxID=2876715 RepID=UPI001E2970BF|nr:DUF937 domain-containing protein [Salinimicrobium sediminilitoris]MCC8358623.1 DUF937 domain-containing protein [Salinimicrobium sediminilitoris]
MASILDFLDTEKGKEFVQKSSEEVNESPDKVKSALGMALPMIMGAIKKNVDSPEGAEDLNRELKKEKHDGSVLDKLGVGGLSGLMGEGSGILSHVLGGSQSKIASAVGSAIGMDASKVSKLLQMAAPVIMGILGKQKRKDNIDSGGGISDLVGSVLGTNSSHDQSMLETFMNSDKGGKIADDIAGKIFGNKDKSKGLGSFFKG